MNKYYIYNEHMPFNISSTSRRLYLLMLLMNCTSCMPGNVPTVHGRIEKISEMTTVELDLIVYIYHIFFYFTFSGPHNGVLDFIQRS